MGNFLHIQFHDIPKEEQEILIARFSDLAVEGFEEGTHFLSVFIKEEEVDEAVLQQVLDAQPFRVTREMVPPKNWNAQWERNFEPVIIDDFCAIRAHFHAPIPSVRFEIIITPKMSFGTGHHATTWLVIKAMQRLDLAGKKVLDFGTGTGILAILAEKMGSNAVIAIDNDDWSIANAAENMEINGCSVIALEKGEIPPPKGPFDIILANINRRVLLANMAVLAQQLVVGGVILISGLLTGDRQELEESAQKNNLAIVEQKERESWIYLLLTKQIE